MRIDNSIVSTFVNMGLSDKIRVSLMFSITPVIILVVKNVTETVLTELIPKNLSNPSLKNKFIKNITFCSKFIGYTVGLSYVIANFAINFFSHRTAIKTIIGCYAVGLWVSCCMIKALGPKNKFGI